MLAGGKDRWGAEQGKGIRSVGGVGMAIIPVW